jgi:hypothetical protein
MADPGEPIVRFISSPRRTQGAFVTLAVRVPEAAEAPNEVPDEVVPHLGVSTSVPGVEAAVVITP